MKAMPCVDREGGPITGYLIHCPACKCGHKFSTNSPTRPNWTFNGDTERPTFTPSMLIRGHLGYDREKDQDMFGTCHSYVTDGMIQFLNDCTHELAGKTVPLEDV